MIILLNGTGRRAILVLCVLVLTGAFFALSVEAAERDKALSLTLKPAGQNKFEFGQVTPAVFTLKNLSDKAIMVRVIDPITNQGEDAVVLSSSVYGSISKSKNEDAYYYNRVTQRATQMSFDAGLLLPGEEVSVSCRYRPISLSETFSVEYVSAKRKYDGSVKSLAPLIVYLPDRKGGIGARAAYRPFVAENWLEISKAAPRTGEIGPGVSQRAVLIPGLAARPADVKVHVSVEFEAFFVDSARKTAARITGAKPGDVELAYSSSLGGYVILEKDSSWLLRNEQQRDRGNLLPPLPPGMLKDVDAKGSVRVRVGIKQEGFGPEKHDAGWKFWDVYPVFYGDGMYTRGEFIQIGKSELLNFLLQVKAKRGRITENRYYFRSRYFVLELEKKDVE